MVSESQSSGLVDPLSAYSGLSLFPRNFGVAPDPSKQYDLDAIHNRLKSMALQSPSKLLEQAKTIIHSSSQLLNSEIPEVLASQDRKEVAVKDKGRVQERRPALGRKRARFSLKPNANQPAASVEPSLDIDQLKDPEEFFLAYERLENATRELQKQIGGVSMDLNHHNLSTTARQRRPGIPGRSVRYKHRYSSLTSENNENVVSSQETFEAGVVDPVIDIPLCETDQHLASQETELRGKWMLLKNKGSMYKPENKVSQILDELLSGDIEDLEGDAAVSILQKHLQIKPVELQKLSLPDLQDILKIDSNSSRRNMPKARNALLDIGNRLKTISCETPKRLLPEAESSLHHIGSPTPPRSPFATLSSLQRRIFQSKPSNDPFSVKDFDLSPAQNSSPIVGMHKESDLDDIGMQLSNSDELKSPLIGEGDNAAAKTSSPEVAVGDLTHTSNLLDNARKLSVGVDCGSSGTKVDIGDNVRGSNMDSDNIDEQLSRRDDDIDVQTNRSNRLEDKVEDMLQEPVEAMASPQPNHNGADSTGQSLNYNQIPSDQSSPAVVEDHAVPGLSRAQENILEQRIEQSTNVSLHEQTKPKSHAHGERKRKEISHRKSLAGAGLFWKSGVRRSTRIRTRPLEYWKGERLLYGRIHESLATVIGLKYVSPTKDDGKPTLKVKSYVSDEYKELVELAALH